MRNLLKAQASELFAAVGVASNTEIAEVPIVIGMVAGEPSGDILGAGLMAALKEQLPTHSIQFVGVGGPLMQAEGLESLADFEALSVNGFRDPIIRLPSLYRLYRQLIAYFVDRPIDVFVGIDFNVFNFMLEGRLKREGIATAHYVSPSVYAWRRGRTKTVARCADALFCLFPFEPDMYRGLSVDARFVGHPLAEQICDDAGSDQARREARVDLGLEVDQVTLALLPGSRGSEVDLMLKPMLEATRLLNQALNGRGQRLQTVIPALSAARAEQIGRISRAYKDLDLKLRPCDARQPLIACDVALVKSGTSTLETMLVRRPMVVTYRLGFWTYLIARALLTTRHIAVPNILAGRMLVPELVQGAATPKAISDALLQELHTSRGDSAYLQSFADLHERLAAGSSGLGPSAGAALGVKDLLKQFGRLSNRT
mgnify:CR=1 FL=1